MALVMEDTTIFLVDDDSAVRDSLCMALHQAGFEVRSFASGEAFVEAYRANGRGCLLLDLRMPGMSGLEVQQWLNAGHSDLPVIFMSGHSDGTAQRQAMEGGALEFLIKPFRVPVLLDCIRRALGEVRAQA